MGWITACPDIPSMRRGGLPGFPAGMTKKSFTFPQSLPSHPEGTRGKNYMGWVLLADIEKLIITS